MRVQMIVKAGAGANGTTRYAEALATALASAGVRIDAIAPTTPSPLRLIGRAVRPFGFDLLQFMASYPIAVAGQPADVRHVATQTMATLLLSARLPRPIVVTVLDLIPLLVARDPDLTTLRHPVDALFYRLAMAGLRRADALIAISGYTGETLVRGLGIPSDRVHVIPLAVDHNLFAPGPVSPAFRARFGIPEGRRHVLYVGSDDPRKNLPTLMRAFEQARQRAPDLRLVIVGPSPFGASGGPLARLAAELDIARSIQIVRGASDDELVSFYRAADLCVMPSLYEGFGLPALESMAAGTPIVAADATALPEVVGDAGILFDPTSPTELAAAILRVLEGGELRERLVTRGLARAASFTWERTAAATLAVYEAVLSQRRRVA